MANGSPTLELAHQMPGRLRLRWRGPEELPAGLLETLRVREDVASVQYRARSRSLLLTHGEPFGLEQLERLTGEWDVSLARAPAGEDPEGSDAPPPATSTERPKLIADLEALLTVGLMLTWIRDMAVKRVFRFSTVLLLIMMALGLWQFWVQRRGRMGPARDETPADLMAL